MRIGFISTRLNGTDGVSLEVEKWSTVLTTMGHAPYYCAGELGGYAAGGMLIPTAHFDHAAILDINAQAFTPKKPQADQAQLINDIKQLAAKVRQALEIFVRSNQLDLIIIENALSIPMNLPLGVALTGLIRDTSINAIAHHHDFYWERPRFQNSVILDLLDSVFPPDLPTVAHVTINSIAQKRLKARRGINSLVIPNVHNFAAAPPAVDDYSRDFRQTLGLSNDDLLILQPSRVIQRKGIEMAIELVQRLDIPNKQLVISHRAGDEGLNYWRWLEHEANMMRVKLGLIDHLIGPQRDRTNSHKIYSLWDVYPHADLVTYPSTYEGFGNALLEAIYFKRLVVVNRYPVYNADIRPLGFEFIELNGFVDEKAVAETNALLNQPDQVKAMVAKNYALARDHFSFEILEARLSQVLVNF